MALQTRPSPWPSVPSSHYACPRGPTPSAASTFLGRPGNGLPLQARSAGGGRALGSSLRRLRPRPRPERSSLRTHPQDEVISVPGKHICIHHKERLQCQGGGSSPALPSTGAPGGRAGRGAGGGDAAPPGPREGKLTLTQMDRRFPRAIRFPRQSKQRWLKRNWVLRRNGDRYSGRGGGWGGNTRAQKHTCRQASPAHLASGNALRHTRASTHDVHHTLLCNSKGEPETTQTATDSLRKPQQNVTQARKAQGLP